jgi:uncharacterized protein (UPF0218 family)
MKPNYTKKQQIIKQIEKKTEQKIALNIAAGTITNPIFEKNEKKKEQNQDVLISILAEGAKEFKEQTGKNMTYGEMRAMFG